MDGWVGVDGWMGGWDDGWMGGCVDGWMGGWMVWMGEVNSCSLVSGAEAASIVNGTKYVIKR